MIALDHIDEVINLIRSSRTDQIAKEGLMEKFGLSERQAQAILDMRLRRLTGLERERLVEEYEGLLKTIGELKDILADKKLQYAIIKEELLNIKEKYDDDRRTQIVAAPGEIDIEDLIDEHDVVLTLTHLGYIKRTPLETYKSQRREEGALQDFKQGKRLCHRHLLPQPIIALFFTSLGKVYELKAYEIPEAAGRPGVQPSLIYSIDAGRGYRP